jgi:hypothetical protein
MTKNDYTYEGLFQRMSRRKVLPLASRPFLPARQREKLVRKRNFPQSRFNELKARLPELRRGLLAHGIPADELEPTPANPPALEVHSKTAAAQANKQIPAAV